MRSRLDDTSIAARLAKTRSDATLPTFSLLRAQATPGARPASPEMTFTTSDSLPKPRRRAATVHSSGRLSRHLEDLHTANLRRDALLGPDARALSRDGGALVRLGSPYNVVAPERLNQRFSDDERLSDESPTRRLPRTAAREGGPSPAREPFDGASSRLLPPKRLAALIFEDGQRPRSTRRARSRRRRPAVDEYWKQLEAARLERSQSPDGRRGDGVGPLFAKRAAVEARDRRARQATLEYIDRATKQLPLSFLVERGAASAVVRERLARALAFVAGAERKWLRAALRRWRRAVERAASHAFMQRELRLGQRDGARRLAAVLARSVGARLAQRWRRWRRQTQRVRVATRRRVMRGAAVALQRWARGISGKARGTRFLHALRKARRRTAVAAAAACRVERAHAVRAAAMRHGRAAALRRYLAATRLSREWHRYWLRRWLRKKIDATRAAKFKRGVIVLNDWLAWLYGDLVRSRQLEELHDPSRLSRWADVHGRAKRKKRKAKKKARAAAAAADPNSPPRPHRVPKAPEDLSAELEARKRKLSLKRKSKTPGEAFTERMASMAFGIRGPEFAEEAAIKRLEAKLSSRLSGSNESSDSDSGGDSGDNASDASEASFEARVRFKPRYTARVAALMLQTQARAVPHRRALPKHLASARLAAALRRIRGNLDRLAAQLRILRWYRLTLARWIAADCLRADAAIAGAVASVAMWQLMSDADRAAALRVAAAADRIKRAVRRHGARCREKRVWAATKVANAHRRAAAARVVRRAAYARAVDRAAKFFAECWWRFKEWRAQRRRCEARALAAAAVASDARCRAAAATLGRAAKFWRYVRRDLVALRLGAVVATAAAAVARRDHRTAEAARAARCWRRHRAHDALMARFAAASARTAARAAWSRRDDAARRVAVEWIDSQRRWYMPVRVIARRRLALLYRAADDAVRGAVRADAALVVRRAIRRRLDRDALRGLVAAQLARAAARAHELRRVRAARTAQHAWARCLEREARRAFAAEVERQRRLELQRQLERRAAQTLQRLGRSYLLHRLLFLRFAWRREQLEKEAEDERRVAAARAERDDAEAATEAAEDALALVKLSAWKMGSDEQGRNYFYNWVTGEESFDMPAGWTPNPKDVWVKNTDAKGNVFYFNQLTQQAQWLPPCATCYQFEARKVCLGCGEAPFCDACWDKAHVAEFCDAAFDPAKEGHAWRGADLDKDVLLRGEAHCLVCEKRKATVVCRVCRDHYCAPCFADVHAVGKLATHDTMPYDAARRGWQEVPGRVDGEQTYYFNVSTGENSYDKPEDLMLEAELAEHRQFKKFQASATDYCRQVDELQVEIERLQYDKDTTLFSLKSKQSAERDELEELRRALLEDMSRPSAYDKYARIAAAPFTHFKDKRDKRRTKRRLYRKMLLLSNKEREEAFAKSLGGA
ncbi:hypothetical protein M885DRAFT_589200 [Pelagophyceae sp. CCMP2097]|nr:hypothetical protein M885DRAFT_589200 [Pelagophyceae sp. CCMP2097]